MTLEPLRDLLRDGYERGRTSYGDLGLDPETYAHGVLERVHARMRADVEAPTSGAWRAAVATAPLADLYLVIACDQRHETAWHVLSGRFQAGLAGTARAEGTAPEGADAFVRAFLADLAAPPTAGTAGTRLGAFDGAGSLLGWLTLRILRSRTPTAPLPPTGDREPRTPADESLLARWAATPLEERVAIACTRRDGLTARRAGALLHWGETRVARAVAAGPSDGARAAALAAAGHRGPCLSDGALVAWVEHRLEGAAAADALAHLSVCDADRALAARLANDLGGDVEPTEDGPGGGAAAGGAGAGSKASGAQARRRWAWIVVGALLAAAAIVGAAWAFVVRT